jgi:phosphoglycerate dehydrogenase-like enzyme
VTRNGTVLITCPPALATPDRYLERFGERGLEVVLADVVQQLSEDQLIEQLRDVDAIVAGDDPLTARVLRSAPRLRVVARWGVGLDNVDLSTAADLGIRVVNTPGVFGEEVADVAIAYLVLLARHLHRIDRAVREGSWAKPSGHSLAGRTVGIIGLGSIGLAVARRAVAMRMSVMGHDVAAEARRTAAAAGIGIVSLDDLLSTSDAVVLSSSLTPGSRHIIDRSALGRMRHGAWLVNVSRGALLDEEALADALRSGRVGGAALDVFESEPLSAQSPLRGFDQVILGSHNGSNTKEAVARVNEQVIDNVLCGLDEVTR